GDTFGRRSGGLRERIAEFVVAAVADAHPVEGAQDDSRPGRAEYNAAGQKRIDNFLCRRHKRVTQRGPDRRRNVRLKQGHLEGRFFTACDGRHDDCRKTDRRREDAEHGAWSCLGPREGGHASAYEWCPRPSSEALTSVS